jgi:UDP-N-acetylmuramoyl-L-alanyl-D-glutamate--2,6-diaminopimelate ligase
MANRTTTVPGVRLRDVLPSAEFIGAGDPVVSGCSADVRQCAAGDVFIVLPGTSIESEALDAIVRAGVKAIIADQPLPQLSLPVLQVRDARTSYGQICQALAGEPSKQLKVIGVAGSSGKTATSHLIASVLCEGGFASGILGSLGYFDGYDWGEAPWTTPTPPVLASWLRSMTANGCTHGVMEISTHALQQSRIAGVDFDVACLTHVRRPRAAIEGNNASRSLRARLLEQLVPEGFAVLNVDDDACLDYLERLDGPVLTVGIDRAAELMATPIESMICEQTYLLSAGSMNLPVRTRLVGRRNIYNGLIAAAVGLAYGMELPDIVRGLEQIESIAGRMERIECGQGFGVFVDGASSGEALSEALETLRTVTAGRVICVCSADPRQDRAQRTRLGRAAESGADLAVITSHLPRQEDRQPVVRDMVRGFTQPESAIVMLDRHSAIGWAIEQAEPGDCVLIAGRGHETYQVVDGERHEFDDREVAREWLRRDTTVSFPFRRAA